MKKRDLWKGSARCPWCTNDVVTTDSFAVVKTSLDNGLSAFWYLS